MRGFMMTWTATVGLLALVVAGAALLDGQYPLVVINMGLAGVNGFLFLIYRREH